MKPCVVCRQPACRELIHFGNLPIAHHFLLPGERADTYPTSLAQCESCGLLQLGNPVPPAQLTPRFDWIKYNEPEAHLDAVVETVLKLPGISASSRIGGLSFNDDSLLRRFRERGLPNTWRIDITADLEITEPHAGIETVQSRIQPRIVPRLEQRYGAPDVIVARMILEHTSDAATFLATLRDLVTPTGYVILDVPDCGRALECLDYTTLWEEHTLYFVEATFRGALTHGGFEVVAFDCHRGPYENCLVAAARRAEALTQYTPEDGALSAEFERARNFATSFSPRREAVRQELERWRQRGRIALFGAGHQSVMFLNLMGVADLVSFVVDDHPQKCGRRMPGSGLPIVNSAALYSEGITLCLSSLGAASEPKVIGRHQPFVEQGGVFASIFPVNAGTIFTLLAGKAEPRDGRLFPV